MSSTRVDKKLLWPVLAGFFIMGLCDLVAPITERIAADFQPADRAWVSFLPTMVFLWFLVLSVPVSALMNRIGRKRTALLGYLFTTVGLVIPYLGGADCRLGWYFVGFGLLGIGNTIVQVAVNPLLATIVPSEKMTSYLTVGQIFRNISLLMLAPIVTLLIATTDSWRLVLPIYAGLTVVGGVWLQFTAVPEPAVEPASVGIGRCFSLLKNRTVLLCAIGIACFIAADVAIGFVSVRMIDSSNSILTTTGFYACRIVGTLIGAWVLAHYSDVKYLRFNMLAAVAIVVALIAMPSSATLWIYLFFGCLGFTMACVFATFYAVATKAVPERSNDVAGLMILAISAGALSGPVCNALIQIGGRAGFGLLLSLACMLYMLTATFGLNHKKQKI